MNNEKTKKAIMWITTTIAIAKVILDALSTQNK